jgi:hypothetical protein
MLEHSYTRSKYVTDDRSICASSVDYLIVFFSNHGKIWTSYLAVLWHLWEDVEGTSNKKYTADWFFYHINADITLLCLCMNFWLKMVDCFPAPYELPRSSIV